MRKLTQFRIFKFDSDRLIDANCEIELTEKNAFENDELVSIGENQVIRSIFKIRGEENNFEKLKELKDKKNSLIFFNENTELSTIINAINKILFIPEIISIVIKNKNHYRKLNKKCIINGKSYSRLLAGAGNIRRDSVIFVDNSIKEKLVEILDAGRNKTIPLVPSKYAAYFSLSNSATYLVSTPKFCVIPDCERERLEKVDWVIEKENDENDVVEDYVKIKFNLFDGQGLISPKQSEKWASELELDYIPASFIVRGPFTKGLLVTFDIEKFCKDKNAYFATDVWGNQVDLREIDVIFTASQVKLWMAYTSQKNFEEKCLERNLSYGISRVAPKTDRKYVRSNYQFLQVLKLSEEEIKKLCEPTISHFHSLVGANRNKMFLYCTGGNDLNAENPMLSLHNPIAQALAINSEMQNDPYIKNSLLSSMRKKIKESYIGSLFLPGNYSTIIADPYALMEHCVGLPVNGLLNEKQHYSAYWLNEKVDKVAACRAPLTFISEVNILNFKNSKKMQEYYKYLNTGIIYNVHGNDCLLQADSDFDGDLIFTTSCKEIIDGAQGGLPISYAKKIASKEVIDEQNMIKSDINGMHSKIGFITNCSSTTYTMIDDLDKNSLEYKELFRRLKLYRYFQGENIDKAKNGGAKEMPFYWFKWQRINDDDGENIKQSKIFNNSLLIEKRPYFFRYIYNDYNRKYLREIKVYDDYCLTKFGKRIKELLNEDINDLNVEEKEIVQEFYKYSFFLYNPSLMNSICNYMEKNIKLEIRESKKVDFDWKLLINDDKTNYVKVMLMIEIIGKYKRFKKDKKMSDDLSYFSDFDIYIDFLRNTCFSLISNNICELASIAVYCSYKLKKGPLDFAWRLFPEGIIQNLIANTNAATISIPIKDDNGDIEYLWKKYAMKEFELVYENNGNI